MGKDGCRDAAPCPCLSLSTPRGRAVTRLQVSLLFAERLCGWRSGGRSGTVVSGGAPRGCQPRQLCSEAFLPTFYHPQNHHDVFLCIPWACLAGVGQRLLGVTLVSPRHGPEPCLGPRLGPQWGCARLLCGAGLSQAPLLPQGGFASPLCPPGPPHLCPSTSGCC